MTFGRALTTIALGTYTYFYGSIDEFAYRLGQIFTAEFSMPTSAYALTAWIQNAYEVNAPCKLGIAPPTSALSGADSGGGSGPNGAYYYKVTYLNVDGYESNPGPASLVVNTVNHAITLTNIPISSDPQVVERRIYRTKAGFTTYYYVKSILNNICKNVDDFTAVTTTPYLDSAADSSLLLEVATNHDEPVPFSEVSSHYSLLYGVEAAERNKVWECTEVDEWEYFAPGNYYTFGSQNDITYVLTSLGEYLCGVQQDRIWTLNTSVTPVEKQKSLSEYGVNSPRAVANKGDAILLGNIAGVWYFAKQNFFETAKTVSATTSVRTLFENFSTNPDRVDPDQGDMIAVGYTEGQVFISYPTVGSSFNNRTVHINIDQKTVEAVWGIGFAAFTLDQATKKLYGVETVSGKVCQLRTTDQDDGSDIAWFMKTKDFGKEFGGLTLKKRGNIVKIDCNPNNELLTVMVFVDGVQVDTKDITGTSRKTERWRLPIDYDWYRLAFKVVGTGYQIVYGFGVEAEVLDF
jgi:hypothetical protein